MIITVTFPAKKGVVKKKKICIVSMIWDQYVFFLQALMKIKTEEKRRGEFVKLEKRRIALIT